MKTGFHFSAAPHGGYYGPPIAECVFRALMCLPSERRHVRISCGDLITWAIEEQAGGLGRLLDRLLEPRHWTTVSRLDLQQALIEDRVYVLAVEGMTEAAAANADASLRREPSYLGALAVSASNSVHWEVYDRSLVSRYRIVGNELRVFYVKAEFEAGGDRDTALFHHWRDSGLFEETRWEDMGLRETIFDEHHTIEYAMRLEELEGLLFAHAPATANELMLRLRDLDPALPDALHAAFQCAESGQSEERLAGVSLSCIGFLATLDHALRSPGVESVGAGDVDAVDDRQRLRAYIEYKVSGHERERLLSAVDDVYERLDRLDALAKRAPGIGENARDDVPQLLVHLLTLAYDVLTVEPPPLDARTEPYESAVRKFINDMAERGE